MRRDPEYKAAWETAIELRKVPYWTKETAEDGKLRYKELPFAYKEREIAQTFGLGLRMLNPEWTYEEAFGQKMSSNYHHANRESRKSIECLLQSGMESYFPTFSALSTGVKVSPQTPDSRIKQLKPNQMRTDPSFMWIEIDFDTVNGIEGLKEAVLEQIDKWYRLYKKERRSTRTNSTDYATILQAGDMRYKRNPPPTFAEIGSALYPGEERENSRRKAEQHVRRYDHLIGGGWREILP